MQHSQENTIHELYLRASSATKKTAPLRLYANVVGKFAVERELADDLRDKIRESTQDAAAQRNNRTTVLLETPPDLPTTASRKRKEPPASSNMFRKPLRPADKPKPVPAVASKPPVASTSTQRDRDALVSLRKRMIQCLAVMERTEETVIKLVAGNDPTASARRDVRDVLEQVRRLTCCPFSPLTCHQIAEPTSKPASDKTPRTYRLKPASWTEARPYEWTGLSNTERTNIARAARLALQTLNIPESDPAWSHVRYRNSGSSNPTTLSDQTKTTEDRLKQQDVVPKRGVSGRDSKEKKPKPKTDLKAEIMMKDESRSVQRSDNTPRSNARPAESSRTASTDSKRADLPSNRRTNEHSETPPVRRPIAPEAKPAKSNRYDEPSPSAAASKHQRTMERSAAPSLSAPKIEEKSLSSQRIKKIRREGNGGGASDSERERSHAQADRSKPTKDKAVVKKEPVDSPRDDIRGSTSKRKVAADYDDDEFRDSKSRSAPQKKRKTEPIQLPSQRDRERDVVPKIPKKEKVNNEMRAPAKAAPRASTSTAPSKPKAGHDSASPPVKRSASNATHARYSPDSAMSSNLNASSQSHKSGSAKPRRRSPIYTSSDEEDTPLQTRPPAKSKPSAPAPNNTHTSRDREAPSRTLPTDHAALRARYSSSYLQYLNTFQQLVTQKGKLDSMLKSNDLGSNGSITDSEGDTELMDTDELAQLTSSHKKLRGELESIQLAFGRTTNSNEPMPAPEMLAV